MRTTLILLHFFIPMLFFAQSHIGKDMNREADGLSENNIYADFSLGYYSQAAVNYENRIHIGEKVSWYGRLGLGLSGELLGNGGLGALAAFTMLTGKGNDHFEISAGLFTGKNIHYGSDGLFVQPVLNIGYRYQKPGGLIFRLFVGSVAFGIGAGYAFL